MLKRRSLIVVSLISNDLSAVATHSGMTLAIDLTLI